MARSALGVYESWTELPLVGLAVVFLAAYAIPILDPDTPPVLADGCAVVTVVVWAVFAVDYAVRLAVSRHRAQFLRSTWLDLASVVLPAVRPLRVLRLVRILRVLDRRAAAGLHGKAALYVSVTTLLVLFVASLAMLDAERNSPQATIRDYSDALWWAITTITTVGYGDRYPVTGQGRLVAGVLMLAGIALLGVVTAAVASWFVQRVTEVQQADLVTQAQIGELLAEVRSLRALVSTAGGPGGEGSFTRAGRAPALPPRQPESPA